MSSPEKYTGIVGQLGVHPQSGRSFVVHPQVSRRCALHGLQGPPDWPGQKSALGNQGPLPLLFSRGNSPIEMPKAPHLVEYTVVLDHRS
jgi:hypothetical protein